MPAQTATAETYRASGSIASPGPRRSPLVIPSMVGPQVHPDAHGFRRGEHHIIVNDRRETATAWSFDGIKQWERPALARGQGKDNEWNRLYTDTPPGLYLSGKVYRDHQLNPNPGPTRIALAFGWASVDLIDLEGQEIRNGRSGIMVHGGGSGLGWPGSWAAYQPLRPTLGCIRMHNGDLASRVLPLLLSGRVFWSVYQEA